MWEWLTMPLVQLPVWQFLLIVYIIGSGIAWTAFLAGSYNESMRSYKNADDF
jgi:hypothetical protein